MDATRALDRPGSRASSRRISPSHLLWATLLAAWIAWEAFAYSGLYLQDVFPSTIAVIGVLASFLGESAFYYHAWTTMLEVLLAFAIGTTIGIAFGIGMGAWQPLGQAAEPYISGLMATPRIVWFPVSLMLFGSGIGSKVALGALGAFFPTVLYAYAGMLAVNPVHKKVGRVFHISPFGMVTKIYLPSLWRPILVGSQIALGVTLTPVLLAEMKSSSAGLGYLVIEHYNHFQITQMYAVLTFLFIFIVLVNVFLNRLISRTGGGMPSHPLGRVK